MHKQCENSEHASTRTVSCPFKGSRRPPGKNPVLAGVVSTNGWGMVVDRRRLSRVLRYVSGQCTALMLLLVPLTVSQDTTTWTLSQLNDGLALCHERVSQLSCDRQRTESIKQTEGRDISSFADLENIYSPVLEHACQWNPIVQTCEYRCNHLYQFPPFRISEQLDSIRIEAHYVFEQYGAACTAFNIVPEQNGNKLCTICEDPLFNPPECYKIKDENGEVLILLNFSASLKATSDFLGF